MALFWFDANARIALFQFYKRNAEDFFVVCFPIWASGMTSEKQHYWKAMERKAI